MAHLGILEGRMDSGPRVRSLSGTFASTRQRNPIGPSFFGDDVAALSRNAGARAGAGRAAEAAYNAAKAAALAAGLNAGQAEAIGKTAAASAVQGFAYDVQAAIRLLQPTTNIAAPSADAGSSAAEDALRSIQADAPATAPAPVPDISAPPPPAAPSPEDVLRSTFPSESAGDKAPAAPTAKSFIIPVAALAAAWFFLK